MVGTTLSDATSLLGGSTLTSGTPTEFNPSRIQPLAGKAINELPVVYLDLFKKLEVVIASQDSYKCNLVVTYQPKVDYESEFSFNPHSFYKIVRFLCSIASEPTYNFDFAKIIAYLKLYLDSTSNLTDSGIYRQCSLYPNEVVIDTEGSYKCNLVVTYQPEVNYESESNFNPHSIYKVVRFLCSIATKSTYNFDLAEIIAYLKLYLDSTSNLTDNGTYRQRTLWTNMDSISDIPEWFLKLREVIASAINCESNMPEVDYWIQREGKFIIRLLSLLIDNERKNIGRIVIEEDPYI